MEKCHTHMVCIGWKVLGDGLETNTHISDMELKVTICTFVDLLKISNHVSESENSEFTITVFFAYPELECLVWEDVIEFCGTPPHC